MEQGIKGRTSTHTVYEMCRKKGQRKCEEVIEMNKKVAKRDGYQNYIVKNLV